MSGSKTDATGLVIGGEPRIDFLPPEVKAGKEAKRTRRSMMALVLVVVAACIGGYVFATSLAVQAQTELTTAQDRTRALVKQQGEYNEVRSVTGKLTSTSIAQLVGSANEVMWFDYLGKMVAALPSGTTIDTYRVTAQMSSETGTISEVPLQNPRIASIDFEASLPALADAKKVLDRLAELDGYADAWMSSIERTDEGEYTANFTFNVNADALEWRFFPEVEAPAVTEPTTSGTEGED